MGSILVLGGLVDAFFEAIAEWVIDFTFWAREKFEDLAGIDVFEMAGTVGPAFNFAKDLMEKWDQVVPFLSALNIVFGAFGAKVVIRVARWILGLLPFIEG